MPRNVCCRRKAGLGSYAKQATQMHNHQSKQEDWKIGLQNDLEQNVQQCAHMVQVWSDKTSL